MRVFCRSSGGRAFRLTAYRPAGESLETKALLSAVLGWSGGNNGNTDSRITPANISTLTEQYAHALDGTVIAEPLSATVDVTVGPNLGLQSLVFVATENDTLYAFNTATGQLVWQTSLLGPGQTPLPASVTHTNWNGITSTPVIDPSTDTIFLVTSESYVSGKVTHYSKTLAAVNMSDGAEIPGSPVVIADTGYVGNRVASRTGPSVRGTGAGSVGGQDYFYVPRELQRPGLVLDGNNLVMAFGAYGNDLPPFHGWILTYNKSTLQMTGVFNDTPNGSDGGIWNSGCPIQVGSDGSLYTETGNGTFDTKLNRSGFPSSGDYGDSVLKLQIVPGYKGPNGTGIEVIDYFTPDNQAKLNKSDGDLASSGVLLLPNGWGGPAPPNLLLASGKQGTIYVINQDDMGHFHPRSDDVVQELPGAALTKSFDQPAFFDNTIYYVGEGDVLKAFDLGNGQLVETSHASNVIPYPGASPVFSSDGSQNGIIWVISPARQLIAYNPANVSQVLWSAPLPSYSEFSIPAITDDGHVEVGSGNYLVGFAPDDAD